MEYQRFSENVIDWAKPHSYNQFRRYVSIIPNDLEMTGVSTAKRLIARKEGAKGQVCPSLGSSRLASCYFAARDITPTALAGFGTFGRHV